MTETNPAPPKRGKAVKVRVLRDYWPRDGRGRCKQGETTTLPMAEAVDCINDGIVARADPITAEDLE